MYCLAKYNLCCKAFITKKGGLGMVEVSCVHRAAQISWIQRLTESNNEKWKVVMLTIM